MDAVLLIYVLSQNHVDLDGVMVFSPGPLPPPPAPSWQALGARIRTARVAHLWAVAQLAVLVRMNPATVRQWEAGHTRPRRHTLPRLATLLDLPYPELAALAGYPVDEGI